MISGYSIIGTGTDVGKTVVSAIVTKAIKGTYLKPLQAGDLSFTDADKVKMWCGKDVEVMPIQFKLTEPMAPHQAAKLDGVELNIASIFIPNVERLVLEGAGGAMVPLNAREYVLDIHKKAGLPVVLVSRNYLGSINHTILTIQKLQSEGIEIAGIVYTGKESMHTESIVTETTGVQKILAFDFPTTIDEHFIAEKAKEIKL